MMDAVFDSGGNVTGSTRVVPGAWTGSAGSVSAAVPALAGQMQAPVLLLTDYGSSNSSTSRSLPRYSYPEAKKTDYSKIFAQAQAAPSALEQEVSKLRSQLANQQSQNSAIMAAINSDLNLSNAYKKQQKQQEAAQSVANSLTPQQKQQISQGLQSQGANFAKLGGGLSQVLTPDQRGDLLVAAMYGNKDRSGGFAGTGVH